MIKNLLANHKTYLVEGSGVRKTEPFRSRSMAKLNAPPAVEDDLFAPSETWLVEPIALPDFSLMAAPASLLQGSANRTPLSLASLKGPTLLILGSFGCGVSREHLQAVEAAWPAFQQSGLGVLVMMVAEEGPRAASVSLPFPVVLADPQTRSIYNIFYRYLFERRRDITLPTAFLLDSDHQVVKVYSGAFSTANVLKDHVHGQEDTVNRIDRALPFKGRYFGPGFHHNYFTYGVAYLQYEFLDQALACFERAVAITPSQAGAYYNIGLIYLNKNVLDKAQVNLEKAVELDPSDANAWNNLGVVSGENGDYDAAQRYFEKTLSLRPSHLLALQNLVKLYDYKDRPADSRRILRAAVEAEPSSAQLHVEFGMFLAGQGDFAQAKEEFASALRLQPQNVTALNGRGAISLRAGDTQSATRDFEQCIQLAPDFDRPYLNMAAVLFNSGHLQQAHDLLASYLQKHPDNQEVKDVLAQVDSKR